MNATTKKLRDIRRLMRRKRTFGEIADACGVPMPCVTRQPGCRRFGSA